MSLMRSILFCRIMMCFSFMISMAAKCSEVWGCGHDSLPAREGGKGNGDKITMEEQRLERKGAKDHTRKFIYYSSNYI